jgi:hypothetical protein
MPAHMTSAHPTSLRIIPTLLQLARNGLTLGSGCFREGVWRETEEEEVDRRLDLAWACVRSLAVVV